MVQKNPLQIKKINKRKKQLPVGRIQKFKRFLHQHSLRRKLAFIMVATIASLVAYQVQDTNLFRASILQNMPEFNGTVYPVQVMPKWGALNGDENPLYKDNTENVVPISNYDPNQVASIYAVEHLAGYDTGTERGSGSHAGFDIRGITGTPIHSSTNGIVAKVKEGDSGFGNHVVVKFKGPSPINPSENEILHFSYSHLNQIASGIDVGDEIKKGQIIGYMGDTGTAAGIHLHFQGDLSTAPFSPYWPFTNTEANEAELGFFEAVNEGLGIENAETYTFHPMEYVLKYQNTEGSLTLDEQNIEDIQPTQEESLAEAFGGTSSEIAERKGSQITLSSADRMGVVGKEVIIEAKIEASYFNELSDEAVIPIKLIGVGHLSKIELKKSDFRDLKANFSIRSDKEGIATVEVQGGMIQISFSNSIKPLAQFSIETDGYLEAGQTEIIRISALDEDGNPASNNSLPETVEVTASGVPAEFKSSQIPKEAFNNGVAEIQLIPTNEGELIIKAVGNGIIGEASGQLVRKPGFFSDVDPNHPNYLAIKALKEANIINGYQNNTFGPENPVLRVEALQMLNNAFEIKASGELPELSFNDIEKNAWYTAALKRAVKAGVIQGYKDGSVKPGQPVNKVEYFKMLLKVNGIDEFETNEKTSYADVPSNEWYTWIAQVAKERNLIDAPGNLFKPDEWMTRAMVAESIYRMQYLMENNQLRFNAQ